MKPFYKEYVGEQLLNLFISYPDMNSNYPNQVIDLRFQVDLDSPKKLQLFEDYRRFGVNPNNARLFFILLRHRQFVFLDEKKIIEIRVIERRR